MRPFFLFLLLTLFFSCESPDGAAQFSNHLADQSSPYLLQHANNPVDWHPWGDEALAKAKAENKLILVSVGYAACHWCHVMEHESFEDTAVARIMNKHFINIKVDREERPDVDDVYMTACHLATGRNCGWPLNAFALPDGRPVWAGTYFPKKEWTGVLEYFIKTKEEEPDKLAAYAGQLLDGIQQTGKIGFNDEEIEFASDKLVNITQKFLEGIDFKKGGRAGAPKFPMPNNYEFLLQQYYQYGNEKALEAVTTTLDEMAKGGIYDHLGGGFARYSTDSDWKVPHFEKMLYDNGQLVSLYAKAYQVTKKPLYKKVVEETTAFIERELRNENGSFYSSLDADSEGEEGKFYVWNKAELAEIFQDEQQLKVFCDYYEVSEKGNWEHSNILYRRKSVEVVAKANGIDVATLEKNIVSAKEKLMAARDNRVRPGLDDKALTSWNALMLKGYVDAYRAFGDAHYLDIALKNAAFIKDEMLQADNRLNRNYKDGKSVINAFLDDYALTVDAFIALYQVTFDEKWLYLAKDLVSYAKAHFFDKSSGMFNYTSDLDPPLIARKMETSDNVIPASNSIIAKDLYLLGLYFYDQDFLGTAKQMMRNMSETIVGAEQPNFYSNWCGLYSLLVHPPYEVAIVGENYAALQKNWHRQYLPNAILLGGKDEGTLELLQSKLQAGETFIYVCQNKVCKFPVAEVDEAIALLEK
ncbi:MAG: thioredoxin domain-containing protein [Bacteroidota bacterium]